MERKQAIQEGLYFYFTGRPCKNGHTASARYTSNGACAQCMADNNVKVAHNRKYTPKREWRL